MGVSDILQAFDNAKAKDADTLSAGKFTNLPKAVQSWMNSWPNQPTDTDILRASGLHQLCPREFVLNYWQPKANKVFDWSSLIRMSIGTELHNIIQNRILGPMGVLWGDWKNVIDLDEPVVRGFHPDPELALYEIQHQHRLTFLYAEQVVWDEEYRISGHIDGQVDLERVKYLWENAAFLKNDPKKLCNRLHALPESERVLLEIKSMGTYGHTKLTSAEDIADYYKVQAIVYQKLSKVYTTLFWMIERDGVASKTFLYNFSERWWTECIRKARIVWESIRDETLPDAAMACKNPTDKRAKECVFGDACWSKVAFAGYVARGKVVAEKEGRKLLDLSGVKFE